jgi:hypothetical protein
MLNMDIAVAGGRVLSSSSPVRSCRGGKGGDLLSDSLSLFLSLSILQERDWVRYVGHMRI